MNDYLKKKLFFIILFILIFVLFFLIIITRLLFSSKNKQFEKKNFYPTITTSLFNSSIKNFTDQKKENNQITSQPTIPVQFTGAREEELPKEVILDTNQSFALRNRLPFENNQFKLDYDYKKDQFVVFLKNNTSQEIFFQWLEKNYPGTKKERFNFTNQIPTISPSSNQKEDNEINQSHKSLIDLLKIIFEQSFLTPSPSANQPSSSTSNSSPSSSFNNFVSDTAPPKMINNYIYFSQSCYGINSQYCQLPLPGGCKLYEAGCGPTTVAMIIANLTNYKNITPKDIVNEYSPNELNCDGSGYSKAKQILEKYGLRTGNFIISSPWRQGISLNKELAQQLRNYQNQGATFFTLAAFKQPNGNYIGHYFWIVNIDEKNNVWSLDPYYGRNNIPYNQNTRYPDPLYELIFPVYKN